MKTKVLMLLVLMMSAIVANAADNATKVLDKTAETYKKAGDVKIGFSIDVAGKSSTGLIKLSGQKFCCSTGGSTAWFDGKTMWHYTKASEEVNVTTPTDKEIAKMNPYAFLNMYKKGYKSKITKTTAKEYYVVLTGKKGSPYKTVEIHLDKMSYQPSYVKMVTDKKAVVINVNSYLKGQKFSASDFTFSKKEFPNAEIVDLR